MSIRTMLLIASTALTLNISISSASAGERADCDLRPGGGRVCHSPKVVARNSACEGDNVPNGLFGICKSPLFRAYTACIELNIPMWKGVSNVPDRNKVLGVLLACEPFAKTFGKKYGNDLAYMLEEVANQRVAKLYGTDPLTPPVSELPPPPADPFANVPNPLALPH